MLLNVAAALFVFCLFCPPMSLKQQLFAHCREHFSAAIKAAEAAIASAREASQNETKSSAGDKYETAREMMQQEIDMNTARLHQSQLQLSALERVDVSKVYERVQPGSLVYTDNGNFFIGVSAGHFTIDGIKYYAISIESPIGRHMAGKQKGEPFTLNGKQYIIKQVS